jgi:hypothetical protein
MGAIKCTSCGASNQLPTGKKSMFCAFCGNSIQLEKKASNNNSKIKFKPEITEDVVYASWSSGPSRRVDGGIEYLLVNTWLFMPDTYHYSLALIEREIESLDEVIYWFSDNELIKIENLILPYNNLVSLRGINKFALEYLDLSGNLLEYIDEMPYIRNNHLKLILNNNKRLKGFTNEVIEKINSYKLEGTSNELHLKNLPNFDYQSLKKINFKKIIETEKDYSITFRIIIDNNNSSNKVINLLSDVGFEVLFKNNDEITLEIKNEYYKKINKEIDFHSKFKYYSFLLAVIGMLCIIYDVGFIPKFLKIAFVLQFIIYFIGFTETGRYFIKALGK